MRSEEAGEPQRRCRRGGQLCGEAESEGGDDEARAGGEEEGREGLRAYGCGRGTRDQCDRSLEDSVAIHYGRPVSAVQAAQNDEWTETGRSAP